MNTPAASPTITKGTKLYSLTRFNAAGFPEEAKVVKVVGGVVHIKSGRACGEVPPEGLEGPVESITLSEWTTD